MDIKTEYKGVEIEYNESFDKWSCVLNETGFEKETLTAVKKKIDDFVKKENAYAKREGFFVGKWGAETGTSLIITSDAGSKVWVLINGKRSKESKNDIAKKNDSNWKKLAEYSEQKRIRDNAQVQMEILLSQLERID